MPVPRHSSDCRTWTFPSPCRDCGESICVFGCTCGSVVLFDDLGGDWPIHGCYSRERTVIQITPIATYQPRHASAKALANLNRRVTAQLVLPSDGQTLSNVYLVASVRHGLPHGGRIPHLKQLGLAAFGIAEIQRPCTVELVDTTYSSPTKVECIVDPNRLPGLDSNAAGRKIVAELRGNSREGYQWWVLQEFGFFTELDFE